MTSLYDYVQIVIDDDWGLVGVVPKGNLDNKSKNMSSFSESDNIDIKVPQKLPEATIVNKRRPIATKHPDIGSNFSVNSSNHKPKSLIISHNDTSNYITPAEISTNNFTYATGPKVSKLLPGSTNIDVSDNFKRNLISSSDISISSLGSIGGKDNLLVGFGH